MTTHNNALLKRAQTLKPHGLVSHWRECDQAIIAELMTLDFIQSATNVILIDASGLGKITIAQNLAHQAVLQGHTVLFTTAGQHQILGELAALDSDSALRRRLKHNASPDVLVIDEIGYHIYSNRQANLFFELINRRHESKSAERKNKGDKL